MREMMSYDLRSVIFARVLLELMTSLKKYSRCYKHETRDSFLGLPISKKHEVNATNTRKLGPEVFSLRSWIIVRNLPRLHRCSQQTLPNTVLINRNDVNRRDACLRQNNTREENFKDLRKPEGITKALSMRSGKRDDCFGLVNNKR